MKRIIVLGAGGFIGNHLVNRLKKQGCWVRGCDIKLPEYQETQADDFIQGDLRDPILVKKALFSPEQKSSDNNEQSFDEIYQLAADMGGAGYIFSGENDANVMHNSASINLNVAETSVKYGI